MFSIVATETSVLTFVSVPGLAYRSDWFFLQLAFGYIVGRILVSLYLLPLYFKGDITSIYEVIGVRFGQIVQKVASGIFLITRLFADGVRFLATAVVVQVVTGWPIWVAVIIIGLVTMVYTLSGGIRTIVWVDSFQFILYLIGGIIIISFILNSSQFPGWESIFDEGKLKIFRFETNNMFTDAWFFGSAFIGGALLSFASHGADYMMVQRVLTCRSLSSARMAMIGSGFFVFLQFLIFLCAGSLIWVYLGGMEIEKDRELASFIVNHLPIGFKGILLAGVLSAAMSTLSSSINSLASSTIHDWMKKKVSLSTSIIISGIWAVVLILISLIFDEGDSAIVVLGFKIASFTYGGLLSLFILSRSKKNFKSHMLIIGLIVSLGSVFIMQGMGVAWTWFIGISVCLNLFVVHLLYHMGSKKGLIALSVIGSFYFLMPKQYQSGLDLIAKENFKDYQDKNIGVVVNHTSRMSNGKHLVELAHSSGINISAIFTPEHGFRGIVEAGKEIKNGMDPLTNAPIYSLYGKTRKPSQQMLNGLDLIIFDMQDIGVRYYTYVSTLTMVMEAVAEKGIPLIILDRLNPLGREIDGPMLNKNFSSFVGMHSIPIQHGMTIGELAIMINEEGWLSNDLKVKLQIKKHKGFVKEKDKQEAFNPPPSPNMPDLETAFNYAGLCLLEGTNLSEGRGTSLPFKIIGAPWIDSQRLLKSISKYMDENDVLDTISFIPKELIGKSLNPKYENQICHGLRVFELEDPLRWTINLFQTLIVLYPNEFQFLESNFIDKLYGSDKLRLTLGTSKNISEDIFVKWEKTNNDFFKMSNKYYQYEN